ncbi:MAG: 16S rRNA (guanine(966)-N(2))-methyltransferase RsmD [Gemmatimonadales bacterium]
MTRIVSGTWRGRRLAVPSGGGVRPTAERVREAWLAILGPELPGARVLDLCAGSGALGLEALSRGAACATFIDSSARAVDTIHRNIATLGVADRTTVRREDVIRFTDSLADGEFDLALADPPFATDLAERLVARFRAAPFAAVLAVEHPPTRVIDGDETRQWGDIAVTFLRAP